MNRWLWIGSLACLLVASTGCRMGCGGCGSGGCKSGGGQSHGDCGQCGNCGGAPTGFFGKLKAHSCCKKGLGRLCGMRGGGDCQSGTCGGGGCQAGPLGWQQGGLDYNSHLRPGLMGHNAPAALNNRPFNPGPPSAQVAYPYYTHRGPRDFLMANPPTIGR